MCLLCHLCVACVLYAIKFCSVLTCTGATIESDSTASCAKFFCLIILIVCNDFYYHFNPTAFIKAKIVYNFGLSECNRVNFDIKKGLHGNKSSMTHLSCIMCVTI